MFIGCFLGDAVFAVGAVSKLEGEVGRRGVGGIWKAILLCLMWCICRKRNARFFEGQKLSSMLKFFFLLLKMKLKYLLLKSLYEWTSSPLSFYVEGSSSLVFCRGAPGILGLLAP